MTSAQGYLWPHRVITEHAVTADEAADLVGDYLQRADDDAALHPNAILSASGPIARQSAASNVIFHNLRRLQAGLRGEHLGTLATEGAELEYQSHAQTNGLLEPAAGNNDDTRLLSPEATTILTTAHGARSQGTKRSAETTSECIEANLADEWQDKTEYEHEQQIEQGEIGDRQPATTETAVSPEPAVAESGKSGKTEDEKAERKARKKKRRKEERKQRMANAV